jgi:hypothetical protein
MHPTAATDPEGSFAASLGETDHPTKGATMLAEGIGGIGIVGIVVLVLIVLAVLAFMRRA